MAEPSDARARTPGRWARGTGVARPVRSGLGPGTHCARRYARRQGVSSAVFARTSDARRGSRRRRTADAVDDASRPPMAERHAPHAVCRRPRRPRCRRAAAPQRRRRRRPSPPAAPSERLAERRARVRRRSAAASTTRPAPTDVVLRYDEGGGFMIAGCRAAQVPHLHAVRRRDASSSATRCSSPAAAGLGHVGPTRCGPPSSARSRSRSCSCSRSARAASAAARAEYENTWSPTPRPPMFTIDAGGIKKTVSVYALGRWTPQGPDAAGAHGLQRAGRPARDFDRAGRSRPTSTCPTAYRGVADREPGHGRAECQRLAVGRHRGRRLHGPTPTRTGCPVPHRTMTPERGRRRSASTDYEGGFAGLLLQGTDGKSTRSRSGRCSPTTRTRSRVEPARRRQLDLGEPLAGVGHEARLALLEPELDLAGRAVAVLGELEVDDLAVGVLVVRRRAPSRATGTSRGRRPARSRRTRGGPTAAAPSTRASPAGVTAARAR